MESAHLMKENSLLDLRPARYSDQVLDAGSHVKTNEEVYANTDVWLGTVSSSLQSSFFCDSSAAFLWGRKVVLHMFSHPRSIYKTRGFCWLV